MPDPLKSAAWPLRRLLDPRFADVVRRLTDTRQAVHDEAQQTRKHTHQLVDDVVGGYTATSIESLSHIGVDLRRLEEAVEGASAQSLQLAEDAATARADLRLRTLTDGGTVEQLETTVADLLNYADSHRGFAAQAGLWFNPPLSLRHRAGAVEVGGVTERVVEVPFAHRALARVPIGGRVLDFGAAESQVSLSLATLGYEVTALDMRPYPLAHERLTSVASRLEDWDAPASSFDAVLCISTVEHVGLGWYGEEASEDEHADRRAMQRLRTLLVQDGTLVVTVPYGEASRDALQRRYDHAGLDGLLEGFTVLERVIVERVDATTWAPVAKSTGDAVALVVATPA